MRNHLDSPVIVGLAALALVVVSNGCAGRPTSAAQPASPDGSRVSTGSDRLRESRLPLPAASAAPARSASVAKPSVPANFPEPPDAQDVTPLPQGAKEPDPRAVIDWLLNQRR